ncbi:YlxR family protein [Prochlorococcus marinus]|uniref:Predicted nucleic-acid-binding protein implicated in transcription termination n=1 Tax=Prochlorococcus marinus (strain MIT 9211) TaxID=93059 RepID=A9BCI4_PROM4|nr:YlxR family protein [Prochlorococcus marinus]ABX09546.1 Predicted nucleic-acid-binding protein implicated in transcription termination [Prochlorococcus marinus str. MIT 9211]
MNQKTVLRRCVACRKLIDRQQLWRVTRDHQGGVVLDEGMGRSAYLCPNEACLEEALRRKRLQKALRCQVQMSILEVLQNRLNSCNDASSEAI